MVEQEKQQQLAAVDDAQDGEIDVADADIPDADPKSI